VGAEEKLYERNYHDEGEHIEEYRQCVEKQICGDVAGVVLQVAEYSPNVLHRGQRVG